MCACAILAWPPDQHDRRRDPSRRPRFHDRDRGCRGRQFVRAEPSKGEIPYSRARPGRELAAREEAGFEPAVLVRWDAVSRFLLPRRWQFPFRQGDAPFRNRGPRVRIPLPPAESSGANLTFGGEACPSPLRRFRVADVPIGSPQATGAVLAAPGVPIPALPSAGRRASPSRRRTSPPCRCRRPRRQCGRPARGRYRAGRSP